MGRTLFLSICALLIAYSKSTILDWHAPAEIVRNFTTASYNYLVLASVLDHDDVAYLGISKFVLRLAEDKTELADMCLNYMSKREMTNNLIVQVHVTKNQAVDLYNYAMTAEDAMRYIEKTENQLVDDFNAAYAKIQDTHAKHFFAHTLMEAQYDRLSRVTNLYQKIQRGNNDEVYSYLFDKYVDFFYHNLYTHPAKIHYAI